MSRLSAPPGLPEPQVLTGALTCFADPVTSISSCQNANSRQIIKIFKNYQINQKIIEHSGFPAVILILILTPGTDRVNNSQFRTDIITIRDKFISRQLVSTKCVMMQKIVCLRI